MDSNEWFAEVKTSINGLTFISNLNCELSSEAIVGHFDLTMNGLEKPLHFNLRVLSPYPYKFHNSDSIRFVNTDLIEFPHIMEDGSVCIHTIHATKIADKIRNDFNALKQWVIEYYLNKGKDTDYEHIIVRPSDFNGVMQSYYFSESAESFTKDEYGEVVLEKLSTGEFNDYFNHSGSLKSETYLVHSFIDRFNIQKTCIKSKLYLSLHSNEYRGLYYYMDIPPALHGKFAFKSWDMLNQFICQEFKQKLNAIKERNRFTPETPIPIFLGYRINDYENHWQVIPMNAGNIPTYSEPIKGSTITEFRALPIRWASTENISYKYFFGRGKFTDSITEKRILIIGLGAIGSNVALTLTRCGCQQIDIADFDIKSIGNICRSQYNFVNGMSSKAYQLSLAMHQTSPFIEVNTKPIIDWQLFGDYLKDKVLIPEQLVLDFNTYDLIFDCTAEDDTMHLLDSMNLKTDIINLSITNKAKDLICAFSPKIYDFVTHQTKLNLESENDLYKPTGCWSPTFKASYNDVDLQVQMALKQINKMYSKEKAKVNFVTSFDENDNLIIRYY